MKKLIISICTVLLILSAPLAAFEWGGVIKDDAGIVTPDFKAITFKQSNAISLWFKAPLGDSNFKLTGEGLYKYNFTANKAGKDFVNIVDLTLFKLDGKINAGSGLLPEPPERDDGLPCLRAPERKQRSEGLRRREDARNLSLGRACDQSRRRLATRTRAQGCQESLQGPRPDPSRQNPLTHMGNS